MWLLSFFLNPTSVLAPLAALALGLTIGAGGGFVKGFDSAVTRHQVAALKSEISELRKASEEKERQLAADRELAESQEASRRALEAEIEKVRNDQANRPNACRLTPEQLQYIKRIAGKVS